MIYLCGTKYDLVEDNKKARKVDASSAKEYADGKELIVDLSFVILPLFAFVFFPVFLFIFII